MKSPKDKTNGLMNYKTILLGVINAYFLTLLLFTVLGLLLYFTKLSETIIAPAVMAISSISIIFCGIKATRDVKNLGWLHGGLIGFIYVALLLLVGMFTGNSGISGLSALVDLGMGFLAGTLSGVLGVNL